MSSLSWTLPVFHFQPVVFRSSFDDPPVKMSSTRPRPSVMKSDRLPVAPGWLSQSSAGPMGGEALLATVLPSSSNSPSSWTASTDGAAAKLKYCKRRDNTKSAVQESVKLRLVFAPMKAQIPRDAIVKTSRSPRQPRYEPLRINPCGTRAADSSTVKAPLRASTCGPLCDGSPDRCRRIVRRREQKKY